MSEPKRLEVIEHLECLPFPVYFGKDVDGILQVNIPIRETKYPFEEGDTYYTIDNGKWVESCWDDVSEEMHDENPDKKYYKSMNLESEVQDA